MKITRILIADDESVVRMSLQTLVDWKKAGCEIVGEATNGIDALRILQSQLVDVVITDIRMPSMDGLELLRQMNQLAYPPATVVLSAYEDFAYVREAFKLGALDYLLKSDMTPESLLECVQNAAKKSTQKEYSFQFKISPEESLQRAVLGNEPPQSDLLGERYYIACFEVDDFHSIIQRYDKDKKMMFVRPMLGYAQQVPRVASRCHICSIAPSRYVLLYPAKDANQPDERSFFRSICNQVMRNWKNYMNVLVSAGISGPGTNVESFNEILDTALKNLSLKLVLGRGKIYDTSHRRFFDPENSLHTSDKYLGIIDAVQCGTLPLEPMQAFLAQLYTMDFSQAVQEVLGLLYRLSIVSIEAGDDIVYAFHESYDFYQKLLRLGTVHNIEIWLHNFLRWIADYMEHHYQYKQADVIERAKRFIYDHCCDAAISLRAVSEYVGLSEKYFSARFNKETGSSFSAYLNELRIAKAKELIRKTDLRIYEISEKVGFNSVEHFTRVFKKRIGYPPSAFKDKEI